MEKKRTVHATQSIASFQQKIGHVEESFRRPYMSSCQHLMANTTETTWGPGVMRRVGDRFSGGDPLRLVLISLIKWYVTASRPS